MHLKRIDEVYVESTYGQPCRSWIDVRDDNYLSVSIAGPRLVAIAFDAWLDPGTSLIKPRYGEQDPKWEEAHVLLGNEFEHACELWSRIARDVIHITRFARDLAKAKRQQPVDANEIERLSASLSKCTADLRQAAPKEDVPALVDYWSQRSLT